MFDARIILTLKLLSLLYGGGGGSATSISEDDCTEKVEFCLDKCSSLEQTALDVNNVDEELIGNPGDSTTIIFKLEPTESPVSKVVRPAH